MVGKECLSVQLQLVDKKLEKILHNQSWQEEETLKSLNSFYIVTKENGKEKGCIGVDLIIEREYDSSTQTFKEKERLANINTLRVSLGFRRKGLGTEMIKVAEEITREFGGSRIEGLVYASKIIETPGLLNFYKNNGFKIERKWRQAYKYKVTKFL